MTTNTHHPTMKPMVVTIKHAQALLGGASRQTIYNLAAAGQLRLLHLGDGRLVRIPMEDIEKLCGAI